MEIIDISRVLNERMATYPLNPRYARELFRDVPEASSALSTVTLGTHAGTHVDAPRHVMRDGAGIDAVPMERLIGPAVVLDLTQLMQVITRLDLVKHRIPPSSIILLKTKNSAADPTAFDEQFVACNESAAEWLVEKRCRAVGIDGPSIKKYQVRDRTHHILLERGIPIIEGLDLSRASAGAYTCLCLPVALEGADGAPARAILVREFA